MSITEHKCFELDFRHLQRHVQYAMGIAGTVTVTVTVTVMVMVTVTVTVTASMYYRYMHRYILWQMKRCSDACCNHLLSLILMIVFCCLCKILLYANVSHISEISLHILSKFTYSKMRVTRNPTRFTRIYFQTRPDPCYHDAQPDPTRPVI